MSSKLARGYRVPKNVGYDANELNGLGIGLNSHTLLIISLPDSRVLRIVSRSLFLAMILLVLPSIGSIIGGFHPNSPLYEPDFANNGFEILPVLVRDLVDEGLIKKGHKGFFLSAEIHEKRDGFGYLRDAGIDLLTGANLKSASAHQVFDFIFAMSFNGIHLIDGILKEGGLVIYPLGHDPSNEVRLLRNFKIVYLRRFESSTIVAMRKMGGPSDCGITPEKKRAALNGLEDVYLEPPRVEERKSSFTSRKIKYLPELLEDSLEEYPRRVFISDDKSAVDWFYEKYPTKGQEFDVYDVEVGSGNQETGVSSWVMKNVRREDYVVMKTEARVVEEMLKDKTLCLVDELFLECRNQWEDGEEESGKRKNTRAYWQCLALYGKVKDEGIAVHQWWY